jgi:hypothetical protein
MTDLNAKIIARTDLSDNDADNKVIIKNFVDAFSAILKTGSRLVIGQNCAYIVSV